jgi:hypothetical protein
VRHGCGGAGEEAVVDKADGYQISEKGCEGKRGGVLTDVDGESEDNAGVVHDADRKVVKRKMGLLTGGEDADVILISKQYNSA